MSPHLYWVWKAFTDLNSRRPVAGMGGYLPFSYTEIEAYCHLKGIYSLGERERLLRLLDVLDREWIRAYVEQSEKDRPSPPKTKVPPSHSPPRGGGTRVPPRTQVM